MAKQSVSYNPGTPQPARLVNASEQLYAVDSFRGEGRSYLVNLKHGRCDCPDFRKRGHERPCKHLVSVKRQATWCAQVEAARKLTDEQLVVLLQQYQEKGRLDVCGAIRWVRHERRQQEGAAKRPPLGTSVKVWGPTTDAEAQATWA